MLDARHKVLSLAAIVATPSFLWAQAGTADLLGQVADPSGAAVVNAHVTLTMTDTKARVSTDSGKGGIYSFPELKPGNYELMVDADGFSRFEQTGINLRTGDRARIDVSLKLGAGHEAITVAADAPLLQAESGSLRQVVSQEKVEAIP